MDPWKWVAGGAILGVVGSMWGYARWCFTYLSSYVVVNQSIDADLASTLFAYLLRYGKRHPFGSRHYAANRFTMRVDGRFAWQAYEQLKGGALFWFGGCPIWVSGTKGQANMADAPGNIVVLRWTVDVERLIQWAVQYRTDTEHGSEQWTRFRSIVLAGAGNRIKSPYSSSPQAFASDSRLECTWLDPSLRLITCTRDEIGIDNNSFVSLQEMSLCPEAQRLVDAAKEWMLNREWYQQRSIPWKLGAYLYGPPGTGKTSLVRAIAHRLDIPVLTFDLSTMDNAEFRENWEYARSMTPAVVLFEDIDAVFDGRKAVNEDTQLTFDAVLQAMSGVDEANGLFMVVTTNNAGALDPALTRPGRAEIGVEMRGLDPDGTRKIAQRILADWPDEIEAVLAEYVDRSGAEVQSVCRERAERRLRQERVERERDRIVLTKGKQMVTEYINKRREAFGMEVQSEGS